MPKRPILAALLLLGAPGALAWDSESRLNPTHATHSYLTEHAIGQLVGRYPEVALYRAPLLAGANTELHELPVEGVLYGVDLEQKRVEHRGTNAGSDNVRGWWADALAAYRAGNREQAYFYLGVLLHMVEDMGVPAHANGLEHQAYPNFDDFEFLALFNWRPSLADINRTDPGYAEPWRYYAFSRDWTAADAPGYRDIKGFPKTWAFADADERLLLQNRQGRTATVVAWALASALRAFARA
ncbi:MAG: hypothetical protein IT535_11525 [Bauldia sp.]|nr:hypothetical protein [Bauldia sp.]